MIIPVYRWGEANEALKDKIGGGWGKILSQFVEGI